MEYISKFLECELQFLFEFALLNMNQSAMLSRICLCGCSQGFVISDWEAIDRITPTPHANYSYSVQAAISAGIDMVSKSKRITLQSMFLRGGTVWEGN